jgi:hypothetical protein
MRHRRQSNGEAGEKDTSNDQTLRKVEHLPDPMPVKYGFASILAESTPMRKDCGFSISS